MFIGGRYMASIEALFKKMKRNKIQAMNIGDGHRLFVLFLIGIVAGTMLVNIFLNQYVDNICIYGEYLTDGFERVNLIALEKVEFFCFCFKKYLIQVLFIVIFNLSSKGKLFNGLVCLYKGGVIAVLICAATISYGSGGVLLFIASIFPHYFLYIPLYIYTFYLGMNLKNKFSDNKHIFTVLKSVGIEGVFIVGTAFLEAYVNLPIIINILK